MGTFDAVVPYGVFSTLAPLFEAMAEDAVKHRARHETTEATGRKRFIVSTFLFLERSAIVVRLCHNSITVLTICRLQNLPKAHWPIL